MHPHLEQQLRASVEPEWRMWRVSPTDDSVIMTSQRQIEGEKLTVGVAFAPEGSLKERVAEAIERGNQMIAEREAAPWRVAAVSPQDGCLIMTSRPPKKLPKA